MKRGFSLIELMIVASVIVLFFGGLFVTVQHALRLTTDNRVRISALSVASDTLEYVRSLSYDAVGTVSGLPSGSIPQVSTTTLNGFLFTKRVVIEYIDDIADGQNAADSNGITTDYKRVKVEISWDQNGESQTLSLVSTVVPRSIETDVGGGTLRVNVMKADVTPLAGASVRLVNTTGTSTIDTTRITDASGSVLFGGAPAGAGYEVFVTKSGYSSSQTYVATSTLPNPTTQPVAVVEADISTLNFFIDELSDVNLTVLSDKVESMERALFTDSSDIATSSNISVTSGMVQLAGSGTYAASGTIFMTAVAPSTITAWDSIVASSSVPSNTNIYYQLYTVSSSTYTLIPDADLPGNSSGFGNGIDLVSLSPITYPSLVVGVRLETSSSTQTPKLDTLEVRYLESQTPRAGLAMTIQGAKTIGTLTDLSPVYKTIISDTTDADGNLSLPDLEWDSYTMTSPTYDIAEICGTTYPFDIDPGINYDLSLILKPNTTNSLRVVITDASGDPIAGATVELTHGSTDTELSSFCGQVFFDSLASAFDYRLTVTAPGYSAVTIDPLDISGDVIQNITL